MGKTLECYGHSKRSLLSRFKSACPGSQQKQTRKITNHFGTLEKNNSFRKHSSPEKLGEINLKTNDSKRRLFERIAGDTEKTKLTFLPTKSYNFLHNHNRRKSCTSIDHETTPTFPPRQSLTDHRSQSMIMRRPTIHKGENLSPSFICRQKEQDHRFRRLSCPFSEQNEHPYIENIRYPDSVAQCRPSSPAEHGVDRLAPGRYPPKLEAMIICKMKIIALKKEDEGNFEHSHDILQNILEVQKVTLGKSHAEVANTSCHLGHVLIHMGQLTMAKSMLNSAYIVLSSSSPSDNLNRVLKGLALVHEKTGDIDSAVNLLQKVRLMERCTFGQGLSTWVYQDDLMKALGRKYI